MNLLQYTEEAHKTCEPQCFNEEYLTLGLISEVGELAGKVKRVIRENIRDNNSICDEIGDANWYFTEILNLKGLTQDIYYEAIEYSEYEIALDILSMYKSYEIIKVLSQHVCDFIIDYSHRDASQIYFLLSALCIKFGANIESIRALNIKKLQSRKDRGVICGEGDNR